MVLATRWAAAPFMLFLIAGLPLVQSKLLAHTSIFISLEGNETDGAAEDDSEEEASLGPQPFSLRHAVGNLAAYQREHPDFASGIAIWMAVGCGLFFIGWVMLLFSEIKAVLVCRDQDFRKKMRDLKYMMPASRGIAELERQESKMMRPRAYLTVGGLLAMYIGLSCVIYPLCDVLDVVGLPAAPCLILVIFGSFFIAFCVATFWMFVCWSCTRPWAALVFLIISLSGSVLLPTGNLILVILWMVVAFFGGSWYFKYLPDTYDISNEERPYWVQDVGHITVSCAPEDWEDANATAWSNLVDDVQKVIPGGGAQDAKDK